MMNMIRSILLIGLLANSSTVNAGPTAEITLPAAPPAPLPQSFKCEKCGAAFDDEGAAAAHIQTCKGPEEVSVKEAAS